MMYYPEPISKLIDSFTKLPGIGPKTAVRLAFFVIDMKDDDVVDFAKSLVSVKRELSYCSICGHITDQETCDICQDQSRDDSIVCVVEDSKDGIAMVKMREFDGKYHVLDGALSSMDGSGPEDINVPDLIQRLKDNDAKEIMLATNPKSEGGATAMYISRLVKRSGIKASRIAHGLPGGGY